MSRNALISVIVPVYNAEQTVVRCIKSILAQSYTYFEILLINDGSTDRSGALAQQLAEKDKRIRIFHKSNGGVSSARNLGLRNAKGDYIVFVDSDDWVESPFLESLLREIIIENVDLVDQSFKRIGFNGQKDRKHRYRKVRHEDTRTWLNILLEGQTSPFPKIYRSSVINENNVLFRTSLSFCEDLIFTLEFMKSAKNGICFSPSAYYNYVFNKGSLTAQISEKPMVFTYEPLKAVFDILNSNYYKRSDFSPVLDVSNVRNKIIVLSMFFLDSLRNNTTYQERVFALRRLSEYQLSEIWATIRTRNPLRRMFYFLIMKRWVRSAVFVHDLIAKTSVFRR